MTEKLDTTNISMGLIANSGEARSNAFEALKRIKEGNIIESDKLFAKAEECIREAHKSQTELLVSEAKGETPNINILLIHAQDHLMTTVLAIELIKEIIELHKEREN